MSNDYLTNIIENTIFDEANRFINGILPLADTAKAVLYNNGNNADFDYVISDAIKLFNAMQAFGTMRNRPEQEVAFTAASDALQAFGYARALQNQSLFRGVAPQDEDLLIDISNRVNDLIARHEQRSNQNQRYSNGGHRHQYGHSPRQENYPTGNGSREQYSRHQQSRHQQPRHNGVSSGERNFNHNSRYGQPASGSNIGRSGGGFGQMRQYEQQDQVRQETQSRRPPTQQAEPSNVINIQRQPDLRQQQTPPPQAPLSDDWTNLTVVQTPHHRPEFSPDIGRVAPTLYDSELHLPLYTIKRKRDPNTGADIIQYVDDIIISKSSEDAKKIMDNKMNEHKDYLFVPRNGDDKVTDITGQKRGLSAYAKLGDESEPFERIDEQITKLENGAFKAKDGATLPEAFTKRVIEVNDVLYGTFSNNAERLFRAVDHVNKRIAPINPDTNYDDLVIAATVRDLLPFTVVYKEDVTAIERLNDYLKSHRNVATCVQTMKKLESILPTREWNTLHDLVTEMVSTIGVVEYALPEGIANFVDEVQKYINLVDQHFGRANAESIATRIYDGFNTIFNPQKIGEQITFNLDYRVVLLPLTSNDLTLSTTINQQKVGIVSEAVMPELHAALTKQLSQCDDTIISLMLYTRDAHAIEVRRTTIGNAILLNVLN